MTDISVFHQNMKNLSTSESSKAGLYKARFNELSQSMGRDYKVAGFTELLGDLRGQARQVATLAQYLGENLDRAVAISIGQTSSPRKVEHIGIAYDSSFFTLRAAGSVLRKASSSDWVCYNKSANNLAKDRGGNGYVDMPPTTLSYKADFRGVAYIVTQTTNDEWYVFGFMHNDYGNGDRSGSFRKLGYAADLIISQIRVDAEEVSVIFGGDFNVAPDNVAGRNVRLTARFAEDDDGGIETTGNGGGNVYDFWLTSENIDFNEALTHTETRDDSFMSDHNGITMEFDY